jgi:predicted nucleotidyltransferase
VINLRPPVEGYFLETIEDYIFEVKGIVHPKDRIIAYLRYIPSSEGTRIRSRSQNYRKLPDLIEREKFLNKTSPQYIWYDKTSDRNIQSVPNDAIAILYDPIDELNHLRDGNGHLNKSQELVVQLAELLVEYSGISWESIGVTGSQLVGLSTDESDIDLVIYGEHSARQLYSRMKHVFDANKKMKQYSGKMLQKHSIFRWGLENPNLSVLADIEGKKYLQGLYDDVEFFIRLVKWPSDSQTKFGDYRFKSLGVKSTKCHVVNNDEAIFTPCRYIVECKSIPDLKEVVSYRGRYTEHVTSGMKIKVRGKMELVTAKDGSQYKRMILGEDVHDFMLPIKK